MPPVRSLFATILTLLSVHATVHAAGDAGSCRYVPVAKVPIDFSDATRRATIGGSINGTPVTLILDTGGYETQLLPGTAERLGIALDQTGKHMYGVSGSSVLYEARLKDFAIGEKHFGKTRMHAIGAIAGNPGHAAIVGVDFLLQMDLELSLAGRYIQFLSATGCDDTFLAYWDKDAMEVPFSGFEGPTRKPWVTVELNGVKLKAILDTGAPRTSVSRHAAALAGITPDSPNVTKGRSSAGIGTELIATWQATFDSFAIGNETIKNAELTVRDESSRGRGPVDVVLGVDFLRAHRILFAMSQQKLYLSYLGGDVFGPPHRAAQ
jgi:predicted aspartyl protease